jgi:hypothetical protein
VRTYEKRVSINNGEEIPPPPICRISFIADDGLTSFILAPRLLIPTRLVADIEGDVDAVAEAASPPRRPESTAAATTPTTPSSSSTITTSTSSSSSSSNVATTAEIPPRGGSAAHTRLRGDPDDDDDDDATPPPRLDERGTGMEKARQQ